MLKFKADYLNEHCHCTTLDTKVLPPFFSAAPHFISKKNLATIQEFIREYEAILGNTAIQEEFRNEYPAVFPRTRVEKGIFNSYDFHISPQGPHLIEINSNAGGAMLSLLAAENLKQCCNGMGAYLPAPERRFDRERLAQMFRDEFHERFPGRELHRVAIVDEFPQTQFFYKEFLLTKEFLESEGIEAIICSPEEIRIAGEAVYVNDQRVDFIYNRLTDFYFEKAESQTLKEIFVRGLVTVSPSPLVHTLYAKKSNLTAFWSDDFIQRTGIAQESAENIRGIIPETVFVTPQNLESLWQSRKSWFFKPVNGFGSKGVYRGDKLTKRVWGEIASGGYIAQRYIEPQERKISAEDTFKYDIRVYTYGAEILGIAARYYQGQTTNFRTPNGGLATVLIAA
jgi:hypothetical protein